MKTLISTIIILSIFSCSTVKDLSYTSVNTIEENKDNLIAEFKLYIPDLSDQKFYYSQFAIDIEIQGTTYPFIIDTGDRKGSLKFSQATMNKLKHSETGHTSESFTLYGINKNKGYTISDIKIGDLTLNDVVCEVTSDSWFVPFNKYSDDIGIIGWNFLREFNVLFDYKNNLLKLYKKGYIPDFIGQTKPMNYTEENKFLYLSGYLNNDKKKYDLLIDSGASAITQTLGGEFVLLNIIFENRYKRVESNSEIVSDNLKSLYITNTLTVDNIAIKKVKFNELKDVPWFLTYKFEGILGSGFFTNNTIFFDTTNNRLYVK